MISSVALLLIGAAIWLSTTDEETLAEELAKPVFATPVAAEEEGGSIFVTDAGTEGDDPSEIIQVNKREKLNVTTWQWFLKKLHKFLMQSARAFVLAMYFAPVILTLPLYKFFPSFHDRWWDLLVKAIENSGAAFVKFGQWAASRSDLFSPEVCDRLGKLRNRAPMHAFAITKRLFQDAFGEPLEEIFAEFPDEPIASGSIAQVYKAKLRDSGETVAVKVRHPWVVDQIQFDLLLIYWMTKQITRLPSFNWMELPVSVRDFAHHLSQQVDLTLEASNLLRFIQNFAGISNVHFPRPIEPYVSPAILVESFEEGVPITHYANTPTPINSRLARMGFTAFLKMLLVDNFVHADCHSDNILVRLDKKNRPEIVMLDVGIVTQLMPYDNECIVALMKILYDRDPNRAADTMVRLSKKQKVDAVVSVPEFRADLHRVFSHIFSLPEAEAGVSRTMTSVFSVMRNHHIKMESNLALLAVSMAVLEGLARKLDPNIDLLPVAFPYLFSNFPFGRALAQLSEGMVFDRR